MKIDLFDVHTRLKEISHLMENHSKYEDAELIILNEIQRLTDDIKYC